MQFSLMTEDEFEATSDEATMHAQLCFIITLRRMEFVTRRDLKELASKYPQDVVTKQMSAYVAKQRRTISKVSKRREFPVADEALWLCEQIERNCKEALL